MGVDHSTLEKMLSAIQKKYPDSVRRGNFYPDPPRIPTTIEDLDALIGGGLPLGRWVHIFGGYSSGKTLIALKTIAEAQRMGFTCAFYDIENQFQSSWAETLGVNTADLLVIDGSIVEEVTEKMEVLLSAINVHVMDSLGMGVTQDELNAAPDEWRPAMQARVWNKCIRRLNDGFDKQDNLIIMLNQSYQTIGGKSTTEVPRGGNMIDYISSLSINTFRSSWLYKDKRGILSPEGEKNNSLTGDQTPQGIELRFKLTKNKIKVRDQLGTARARLELGSGGQFDEIWGAIIAARYYGLVTQKGSWYEMPNGDKVQGENGIREYMATNPDFYALARETMRS